MKLKGFSTIISIIFLMAFASIIMIGAGSRSISQQQSEFHLNQSIIAQQYVDSCIEESLRRLKDSISYTGGQIPFPEGYTCTSTISGPSTSKQITATISTTNSTITKSANISLTTNGATTNITITNWSEN
jgi:hypothetical protein